MEPSNSLLGCLPLLSIRRKRVVTVKIMICYLIYSKQKTAVRVDLGINLYYYVYINGIAGIEIYMNYIGMYVGCRDISIVSKGCCRANLDRIGQTTMRMGNVSLPPGLIRWG